VLLVLFGYGADYVGSGADGWLHGLKIVAVAVVALAVWSMAKSLAFDRLRGSIALLAAILLLAWHQAGAQVVAIVAGGIIGYVAFRGEAEVPALDLRVSIGRRTALVGWVLFFGLLIALPLARQATHDDHQALNMADGFYRSGALVFGGGHVVLPLLENEVVDKGWVSDQDFLAGYGAAQAVPGPLFTFAPYLGTVMGPEPNGVAGASIALIAIFLPSFLITIGVLPVWGALRARPWVQPALRGVNAAVVGVLLAALYDPVFTSSIHKPTDVGLAFAAFGALALWKAPPWVVVVLTAAVAALMNAF
jgi:chromate transporter